MAMASSFSLRCCVVNTTRQLKEDGATTTVVIPHQPRTFVPCQGTDHDPFEKDAKLNEKAQATKRLQVMQIVRVAAEKAKASLSPKQKGDWKDVMLMSISFAVYVYMSQKIVCAYCVWMSMLGQH